LRVLADTTRNAVIVVLMFAIGYLVGFRVQTNFAMALVAIGLLILFGLAWAWLMALIGLSVSNGEAAQAAAFPLLAPLTFASNLFVDPNRMPRGLAWWGRNQPVSVTADAVRACLAGGPTAGKVGLALLWTAGASAVLAPLAVRRYRNA
jgi:ABC-type multidrug transport system permease subunit